MLNTDKETQQEIFLLKKRFLATYLAETVFISLTYALLIVNFCFAITCYYIIPESFSDQDKNTWIYAGTIFIVDLIIILFSSLWFKLSYKTSYGHIPIPKSGGRISLTCRIVSITNTLISIFGAASSAFVRHGSENKVFFFLFSLQTIFLFLFWGLFVDMVKKASTTSYIKKIKIFGTFDFTNVTKYEIYIKNHYEDWVKAYNNHQYEIHKNISKWQRFKQIIKFDFEGKKWKENIIKNYDMNAHDLDLIFSDKTVTNYDEFCKYRFCVLSNIFRTLYSSEGENDFTFKMFYWVRENEAVKDFERRIHEFR